MTAEWAPIAGYEGLYEISSAGTVRSLPRAIHHVDGRVRHVKGYVIRPCGKPTGHLWVWLANKKKTRRPVHQLVLETFVGPRPPGTECCHRDGNPVNNAVGNLYWGTRKDNMQDALRHGSNPRWRMTECSKGHPYTEENTYVNPFNNQRVCLECKRRYAREWARRKRAAA